MGMLRLRAGEGFGEVEYSITNQASLAFLVKSVHLSNLKWEGKSPKMVEIYLPLLLRRF